MNQGAEVDEHHRDAFRDCLDRAIARTAMDWYDRLKPDPGRSSADHVKEALKELGKLSANSGEVPRYGSWEAPFYVTWYQPRQINLIYRSLHDYVDYFSQRNRRLHFIDYGCGALSLNFAVVALLLVRQDLDIRIHAIDSSGPMLEIGRKIWAYFGFEVKDVQSLRRAYNGLAKDVRYYP